jgi:hypothetical protein
VAAAAPRDGAARKKIDQAVNTRYVAADFAGALALLTAAINECRDQCSPAVLAQAWMYVGIVRGGGKNDQKGAKEAFLNALASDPKIVLDDALATPSTKKTFAAAQREAGALGLSSGTTPSGDGGVALGGSGEMVCSLDVNEVQTRRPIPIACSVGDDAKKVDLHYKVRGGAWKTIKMKKKGGTYQATIPCSDTARPGPLRYYVRARNADGDPVASHGKKSQPEQLEIVRESDENPPAFPGRDPPRRCPRSDSSGEAEEEPSCEADADCHHGKCIEGRCESRKPARQPARDNWLGLHFAYDFAYVGGTEVCSLESQRNEGFACFYKDTEQPYRFDPQPKASNAISKGIAPATFRGLISYDRLLGENITAGLRVGYAFNGGPPSGKKKDVPFLPWHAEIRGSYWFGEAPFASSGVRAYAGAQAGAAQVDSKFPVKVGDCGGTEGGPPSKPGATAVQDATFYQACKNGNALGPPLELDAYKKLGKGFVGIHLGLVFAVTAESGAQFNVNLMQMLPTAGQVIEPSLGYVVGL